MRALPFIEAALKFNEDIGVQFISITQSAKKMTLSNKTFILPPV